MEVTVGKVLFTFSLLLAVSTWGLPFCAHGVHGTVSSYLRVGLWKYCTKYLTTESWQCQKLDFWERSVFEESELEFKLSRSLFISDHVVSVVLPLLLLGYGKWEVKRPLLVRMMLPVAAIHVLVLNFATASAEMAYDRFDHLELGWSQILPIVASALSIGQFGLMIALAVYDARHINGSQKSK